MIIDGEMLSSAGERLRQELDDPRDSAFALACCYGVLRHYFSLRSELHSLLQKPLRGKDADVEMLLLAALYQIRHMQVPAHAAVSSHVDAVRALKKSWAGKLVNAVLRRALREPPAGDAVDADFEHPAWLAARIRRDWPQDWRTILRNNNEPAPLTVRINPRHTSVDAWLAAARDAGIAARPARHAVAGAVLKAAVAVERLPGFAAGHVSVQDAAAQLAAPLLDPVPGSRVLDACAAPGGKTTHLLECLAGSGSVLALDRDARRLDEVAQNIARLGQQADLRAADAAAPASWWDGQAFDRILLDAPCSATGVIRRHPDIRFHRTADDVATASALQQQLLQALWPLLRPGGKLVYATCSILPAENDGAIDALRAACADATPVPIDAVWGRATRHGRQILPGEDAMDGFYYALLQKPA